MGTDRRRSGRAGAAGGAGLAPLRPRWLIGALTVAAPGLDAYRRLHTTWRERKAGPGEAAMPPAWRALTQLVPVHGLFRSHARMRAIRELLARPDRGALPARNFT